MFDRSRVCGSPAQVAGGVAGPCGDPDPTGWPDLADILASLTADDAPEAPPANVAEIAPSGWLALELDLDTDDPARLSDAQLIDATIAWDRVASWAAARQARVLAEFARRRPGDDPQAVNCRTASVASRWAPDEIGLALRLSRGSAMVRLGQAAQLGGALSSTLDLLELGRLDSARARAICDAVAFLEPEQAAAVQDRVLPKAPDQTLAQLRTALARAVLAIDPRGAAERHRSAHQQRHVRLTEQDDGMSSLSALLAAPDAAASYQWLTRLARGLGAADPREMDARRADLLVDLLTGRLELHDADPMNDPTNDPDGQPPHGRAAPGPAAAGKPLVHVVMRYSTLLGRDDQPCELAGYGPIPAELGRQIASDAVWKRLVTDPLSGALLDLGRTTYRPPAALADFVRARDGHCRSPICRRQPGNCELDHAIAWAAGGSTAADNLLTGCVHDHHLKHQPGWRVWMIRDGLVEWVTPTGHRYLSGVHDYWPDDPDPPMLRARAGPAEKRRSRPQPRRVGLPPEVMFGRARPRGWPARAPADPAPF